MSIAYHQPSSNGEKKICNIVKSQPESIEFNLNPGIDEIQSYQCWSIFNTLCCCLCFGILASIYSKQTEQWKRQGDFEEASKNSRNARNLNIIATITGMILIPLSIYYEWEKLKNM